MVVKNKRVIRRRKRAKKNNIEVVDNEGVEEVIEEVEQVCRYCLDRVDINDVVNVAKPCKCNTYIHQSCYKTWWEYSGSVKCELCHVEYDYIINKAILDKDLVASNIKKLMNYLIWCIFMSWVISIPYGYNNINTIISDDVYERLFLFIGILLIGMYELIATYVIFKIVCHTNLEAKKKIKDFFGCVFNEFNVLYWLCYGIILGLTIIGIIFLSIYIKENILLYKIIIGLIICIYFITFVGMLIIRKIFIYKTQYFMIVLFLLFGFNIVIFSLGSIIRFLLQIFNINFYKELEYINIITYIYGLLVITIPIILILFFYVIFKTLSYIKPQIIKIFNKIKEYFYPTVVNAPVLRSYEFEV